MQTLFRTLNIILGPLMTLVFAAHFAGLRVAGKEAGDAIGGILAGLVMLAIELGLTQGPKYSSWLRRHLDRRAAFEGIWLQDVIKGHEDNRVAVFTVDYERESDALSVQGHAYSGDGRLWAKWHSTQVSMDAANLAMTYLWEGEAALGQPIPTADKVGLAKLALRKPAAIFSLPMKGDGGIWHVGETSRLEFRLQRITDQLLTELGLTFTERDLRVDAHDEESRVVAALLRQRASAAPRIEPASAEGAPAGGSASSGG
jgi:hypothetical protein